MARLDDLFAVDPEAAGRISCVDGCWVWGGNLTARGYGRIKRPSVAGGQADGLWFTHRYVWTVLVGPIDEMLVIDHICRNHACVRPDHLRPVRQAENIHAPGSQALAKRWAERTACSRGHEYVPGSHSVNSRGWRRCLVCERLRRGRSR